jgi:hypothetical protein
VLLQEVAVLLINKNFELGSGQRFCPASHPLEIPGPALEKLLQKTCKISAPPMRLILEEGETLFSSDTGLEMFVTIGGFWS